MSGTGIDGSGYRRTTKVESDPENGRIWRTPAIGYRLSRPLHPVSRTIATAYTSRQGIREGISTGCKSKLPGKEIAFGAQSKDENIWIVNASSDTEPGETYMWNRKAKRLTLQYRVREEFPRESLSARQPYHFKSSDGLDIPAYLTLPKGFDRRTCLSSSFRTAVHGRATVSAMTRSRNSSPTAAIAVLQPNFRGSTGYGKKFLNAGNGEWGRKMQDDLTWGVKALVADGTVDPKRVGIFGGSTVATRPWRASRLLPMFTRQRWPMLRPRT